MKNLILFIFLICSISGISATKYVSKTGNNSNDGSSENPWLTLAYACTQVTSGDVIHINAGVYTETAQAVVPVGVNIEGASKATTIINYTYNSGNEYVGCISLVSNTDGTNGNQSISQLTLNGTGLTAKTAIVVWGRSNVKIHDIAINDFNNMGVVVNGNANGSSGFVPTSWATGNEIYNCNIFNSSIYSGGLGRGAIWFGAQNGMKVYNCNIDQTTRPTGNNGYCIKVWGGGNKGSKIYNNYLNKALSDGTTWDFAFEGDSYDQGGLEIYNNTIIGAIDLGARVKGDYAYSCYIHNNRIGKLTRPTTIKEEGIVVEDQCTDLIIRYNYFYNLSAGVAFNSGGATSMDNIYIQYNIFDQLGMSATNYQSFGIYSSTINTASTCSNWFVDNNVFIGYTGTTGDVGIMLPSQGGADCTNINIRNNIFKNLDYAAINANGTLGGTISVLKIQNNIIWGSGNSNDPLWEGGFVPSNYTSTNNQKADPLLVSTTDFNLQSSSPAINAGIDIGLTTDYSGVSIVGLPDIGALENINRYIKARVSSSGKPIRNSRSDNKVMVKKAIY